MCLKEKILRSRFLPFLDDFRYAGATIVALCSQGLKPPYSFCQKEGFKSLGGFKWSTTVHYIGSGALAELFFVLLTRVKGVGA
jgi:hypothetical protein